MPKRENPFFYYVGWIHNFGMRNAYLFLVWCHFNVFAEDELWENVFSSEASLNPPTFSSRSMLVEKWKFIEHFFTATYALKYGDAQPATNNSRI